MNTLRKALFASQGRKIGGSSSWSDPVHTLLISDVPETALHVVGSGPSLPDPSTAEDCGLIIAANSAALNLSEAVLSYFNGSGLEETPVRSSSVLRRARGFLSCRVTIFAGSRGRLRHVSDFMSSSTIAATIGTIAMRRRICRIDCRSCVVNISKVCLLSGGEISVQIPPTHGIGGRNQQFVLECARLIAERRFKATVLSGGSDRADGNSRRRRDV